MNRYVYFEISDDRLVVRKVYINHSVVQILFYTPISPPQDPVRIRRKPLLLTSIITAFLPNVELVSWFEFYLPFVKFLEENIAIIDT